MAMGYPIRCSLVLFRVSIFTHFVYLTIAQSNVWNNFCSVDGSYTQDSPYRQNLDTVLNQLKSTNNGYGFFHSSASNGQELGTAFAVALCKGDIGPDDCARCVDGATRDLRWRCPYQWKAYRWYDDCLLSYSSSSLLYTVQLYYRIERSNRDVLDWVEFSNSLGELLARLQGEAARGGSLRKYAVGSTTERTYSTIYGSMQCTPDLSEDQCDQCLREATTVIVNDNARMTGVNVYGPNCLLRYDVNLFFKETWYPPPPPPPLIPPPPPPPPFPSVFPSPPLPERKRKTSTTLIVGSTLAASAVAILIFFFICLKIGRKRKGKGSKQQRGEDPKAHPTMSSDVPEPSAPPFPLGSSLTSDQSSTTGASTGDSSSYPWSTSDSSLLR